MKKIHLKLRITITPAGQALISGTKADETKRPRVLMARIDLNHTDVAFVKGIPDHTLGIPRDGAAAYVLSPTGKKITDDRILRTVQGIPLVDDMLHEFEKRTGQQIAAWSGTGNTCQNTGCIAFHDGHFSSRIQEAIRLSSGVPYPSLVIRGKRASIEDATFRWNGATWVPNGGADLIVSGQRLVLQGTALDIYGSQELSDAFSDPRHLALNAYCKVRRAVGTTTNLKRDFGQEQLLAAPEKLRAAIAGAVVQLEMRVTDVDGTVYAVAPDDLREAFAEKGYDEADSVAAVDQGARGLFAFEATAVYVRYLPSPYPHHVIATREDDPHAFYDIVIGGWSNNIGVTIADLSSGLAEAGFRDAVLLDNGGDAVFVRGAEQPCFPQALIPTSLPNRTQWAAAIAYSCQGGGRIEYGVTDRIDPSRVATVVIDSAL